jgi:hypothetical protein
MVEAEPGEYLTPFAKTAIDTYLDANAVGRLTRRIVTDLLFAVNDPDERRQLIARRRTEREGAHQ